MAKDTNPADHVCAFEAELDSYISNKSGVFVKIEINPDDVPEELALAKRKQRFYVVLTPMPDDMPEPRKKELEDGENAISSAAILCKNAEFQDFLGAANENEAASELRRRLRIGSRKELRTNKRARKEFYAIQAQFSGFGDTEFSL